MYRTSADPHVTEIVYSQKLSTSAGKNRVGVLLALAIVCLAALAVTVFVGAPRELEGKEWTMALGAALFGVPAMIIHARGNGCSRSSATVIRFASKWTERSSRSPSRAVEASSLST